jgi:acetyltransferase-like isoleucine patch superfamily enzyme
MIVSKLNKLFRNSVYENIGVITYKYHQLITKFWLGFFLKENGNANCIIKPILLTPKFMALGNYILIRNGGRVEGVSIYQGVKFNPEIVIGDFVSIEQNIHLTCAGRIEIMKYTAIASCVTITDINHRYIDILTPPDKQPIDISSVIIGEHCKIYNNAVILPGVRLGKHNIVAANSVVLSGSYPDYCVIAGIPAKIIKRYNFETQIWQKTNDKGEFLN